MKKNTKAAAVKGLLKKGYTAKEIMNRVAVSESYIYTIKKKLAKETTPTIDDDLSFTSPGEFIQADTNVDAILDARGSRYGNFMDHATITYRLKEVARDFAAQHGKYFAYDQCEAFDMIFHKLGRILNGDPNYADSWIDIAGYAKLVADRLEGKVR